MYYSGFILTNSR